MNIATHEFARQKRSQNTARFFLALITAIALLLTGVAPASTAAGTETEKNDSTSTATALPLGTTYSGSTFNASSSDSDYYAVNVPGTGRIKIDLKYPANLGTGTAYGVYVYNSKGAQLYGFTAGASDNTGTGIAAQGIYLPAGTAYIRIYGDADWDTWGKNYTLNVSHTAAKAEAEQNDSTSTATALPLGTTYSGSVLNANYSDNDYYAINVPGTGRTKIDLKYPANLGTGTAYGVYVYNSKGAQLYGFTAGASDNTGTGIAAQGIYLPAGTAYIRIYGDSDWDTWGKNYTLNVSHTAAKAEAEQNNSTSTATALPLGTTYSGSTLSTNYADNDYYAVNVPGTGRTKIDLKYPANLGTGTAYEVYVYNAKGAQLYSFTAGASDNTGTGIAAQGIYLPAGTAYIRIYGDSDWDTWGKSYTLNVSHTAAKAETEQNNSTSTATALPLGTTYTGSALSSNYSDNDYYGFNLPVAGSVTLGLTFTKNLGGINGYYIGVYNSSGSRLYDFDVDTAQADGSWLSKQTISLPAGRSYVQIYGDSDWSTWGKSYGLTVTGLLTAKPKPTISGTATVGSTLTASAGSWKPAPVTLKYQWLRDGTAISGATKATYKLAISDAGKKISVRVTGSKSGYKAASTTSTEKSVPLLNLTKTPTPTISGTVKVGSTLTSSSGSWAPAPVTLKYQWLRDDKSISGATKTSYKLVIADAGKKLSVKVTGSKTGYKTISKSSSTKSIPLVSLTKTPTPAISGTAKVSSTLKASAGTWAPATVTLKYQWLRNGKSISGATKSSYKLVTADGGQKVSVKVTGSKNGYQIVSKTSSAKTIKK